MAENRVLLGKSNDDLDYGLYVSKTGANVLDPVAVKSGSLLFDSSDYVGGTLRVVQTGHFQFTCTKQFFGKKGSSEILSDEQNRANNEYVRKYPWQLDNSGDGSTMDSSDVNHIFSSRRDSAYDAMNSFDDIFSGGSYRLSSEMGSVSRPQDVGNVYCDYGTVTCEFNPPLPDNVKTPHVSVQFALANSTGHFHPWYANVACVSGKEDYEWEYTRDHLGNQTGSQQCVHMDSAWFRGKWSYRQRLNSALNQDIFSAVAGVNVETPTTTGEDSVEGHGGSGQYANPGDSFNLGEVSPNDGRSFTEAHSGAWGGVFKCFAGLQGLAYYANNTHLTIDGFMTPTHTPTPFERNTPHTSDALDDFDPFDTAQYGSGYQSDSVIGDDGTASQGSVTDWIQLGGYLEYTDRGIGPGAVAGNDAFANSYAKNTQGGQNDPAWDDAPSSVGEDGIIYSKYGTFNTGPAGGASPMSGPGATLLDAKGGSSDPPSLASPGVHEWRHGYQKDDQVITYMDGSKTTTKIYKEGSLTAPPISLDSALGTENPGGAWFHYRNHPMRHFLENYKHAGLGGFRAFGPWATRDGLSLKHWIGDTLSWRALYDSSWVGQKWNTTTHRAGVYSDAYNKNLSSIYHKLATKLIGENLGPHLQRTDQDRFLHTHTLQGQPTGLDSFWNSFSNNMSQFVNANTPYGEMQYAQGGYGMMFDHAGYVLNGKFMPSQMHHKASEHGGNPKLGIGTEGPRYGFGGAGSVEAVGSGGFDTYIGTYVIYDLMGGNSDE